jgi:hypothetical protein
VTDTSLFSGAIGICASEAVVKSSAPAPKIIAEVRAEKVFIERIMRRNRFTLTRFPPQVDQSH